MATEELPHALNRVAGTSNLSAQGAANAWVGTTGLDLLGALNRKAGTTGLGLLGVLNRLAGGTTNLAPSTLSEPTAPSGVNTNCTVIVQSSVVASGTTAYQMTANGVGGMRFDSAPTSPLSGMIAVTPGQTLYVTAKFRAAASARTACNISLVWYRGDGSQSGLSGGSIPTVGDNTTSWTTSGGVVTVPADAAYLVCKFRIDDGSVQPGEVHYVDDIGVIPSAKAVPWVASRTGTPAYLDVNAAAAALA